MIIEQYFHPSYEHGDDPIDCFIVNSIDQLKQLDFVKKWTDSPFFVQLGRITRERARGVEHLIVAALRKHDDEEEAWHNVAYILNCSNPEELWLSLVAELIEQEC